MVPDDSVYSHLGSIVPACLQRRIEARGRKQEWLAENKLQPLCGMSLGNGWVSFGVRRTSHHSPLGGVEVELEQNLVGICSL